MPGLLAVLVMLALAPSLLAQVNITIASQPSPNEILTNHAAQTGDPSSVGSGITITGSVLSNAGLTTTVLAIAYPSTITSSPASGSCDTSSSGTTTALPAANTAGPGAPGSFATNPNVSACPGGVIPPEDPIQVVAASGVFTGVSNANLRLNTNLKRIEIDLPGCPSTNATCGSSGAIRITGARVDMNGITAPVTATASLGNAGANNYQLSTTTFTVINGASAGIGSLAIGARSGQTNLGTGAIFTNRTVPKGTASFIVTGGFAGAFRNRLQLSNSGNSLNNTLENSTQIRLTFNNIPSGVTLNLSLNGTTAAFCIATGCNGVTSAGISSTTTVSSASASSNVVTLEMVSPSLTTTPTIEVDISSISVTSTAAVTTPSSISVTATMNPICTAAVDASGTPTNANGYPCFNEVDVGPLTIVNILPTSTTMLMPYAIMQPPFDTGIAIANTTADPFASSGGSATPTSGTVRLDFFPTTGTGGAGTPFSLSTSSTVKPGAGLSSDGTVAAGATWTVLLSALLPVATPPQTGNFTGYIFITANFLNAHGTATISDFRTYSLTANVLVLPPPSTTTRSTPANGAEALDF